jgi:predicted  nucleic acid-binding Zn-ribbon protein
MARVDSAIAGVQERDKWRRRLEALERALTELSERRRRLELRMRRVHKELAKLELTAREFVEVHGRITTTEVRFGPRGPFL